MSYGQVVAELTKSLDTEIVGYDNMPDHGGCILYMKGPVRRIDITIEALDRGPEELAEFIRELTTGRATPGPRLLVGVRDGTLVLL